ncbi:MAG TPA: zinc-binding dehydrogenase [bacterium]
MKAVIFDRFGGPEVLRHADVPDPSPGPGEVLVRVEACSINRVDCWVRQGLPAYRTKLPHVSGADIAGIIERVGPGVSAHRPGARVVLTPGLSCGSCARCQAGEDNLCDTYGIRGATNDGGYAEFALAREQDVLPLVQSVPFEQAAAFPLVFLTAWHMLVARAAVQSGERVLVHAAGSGVGHAAVQIAKLRGAVVYATVGSDEKAQRARELGAEEVINYGRESFADRLRALTGGRGVDVVVEHVGPAVWEDSVRALAKGGRLVTCGATTGPQAPLDLRYVFSRQLSVLGSIMGTRSELVGLLELLAAGRVKPVVHRAWPLAEARAAQEQLLSRAVFGKLILIP